MFAKRPQETQQSPALPTSGAPGPGTARDDLIIDLEPMTVPSAQANGSTSGVLATASPQAPARGTPRGMARPGARAGTRPGQATSGLNESVISSDLTIYGNVSSRGRIRLEGKIEGELNCEAIEVGETGAVEGGIKAEDVEVRGKVSGTIKGGNVMLYSSAHVEGDILHRGIGIEMGTHYDGRLTWDKTE